MEKEKVKDNVLSGLVWRFGERICAQGVSFIVSIILARLLAPDDYGIVAILLIFIDIGNVFVVSGFGVALVQKKDVDSLDYSSVFYFNLIFSLAVYGLIFILAPFIADFYNIVSLCWMLRVLALKIPLAGVNSIQQAYVQKNMIFKKFFFSTIIGTVISAVVGILLAYKGVGALALVVQYLTNSLCDTIVLWITVKWRPIRKFSWNRLMPLIRFGWKMLVASILNTFYVNLRSFVIGKIYSSKDLGYYNQGRKIPQLIVTNINTTIDSVLLPAMASTQDEEVRLKSMVRKSIRMSSIIMCPMMLGLFAVADNLIVILLTDKWLPCLPFMRLACVQFALEPVQTANLQAIKALGKSDIVLKMEILKKGYGILALLVTMKYGMFAIAVGGMTQTFIALLCNSAPNRKLLKYNYREQVLDIIPSILSAVVMCIVVILIGKISLNSTLLLLVIQILFGSIIYIIITYFVQKENFIYICKNIKKIFKINV